MAKIETARIARLDIAGRAYLVEAFPGFDGVPTYYFKTQPINAKTGQPWQASKDLVSFEGENARARAMRHWLYATTNAKKAAR